MDEGRIRAMIQAGATLRDIAEDTGRDVSTVRLTVLELGLETGQMASNRASRKARLVGSTVIDGECSAHGTTRLQRDAQGAAFAAFSAVRSA